MLLTPTSLHSFLRENERNSDYAYQARHKKEVVLMGNKAFEDFLASIQARIGNLNDTVTVLKKRAAAYQKKVDNGNEQGKET